MNESLYLKIKNHIYEDNQILDIETLKWLKKNYRYEHTNIFYIHRKFKPLDKNYLIKIAPNPKMYITKKRSATIHGESHALRTVIITYILCIINNIRHYKKYLIAASVHDLLRKKDTKDENHGNRAAKWFIENNTLFGHISMKTVKEISVAIQYHDTDYDLIPKEIISRYKSMIDILKCADALERYRLPKKKWWPKKELMPIKLSDAIFNLSLELIHDSESLIVLESKKPLSAIIDVGIRMKLIE
jgi:hypothetical protein